MDPEISIVLWKNKKGIILTMLADDLSTNMSPQGASELNYVLIQPIFIQYAAKTQKTTYTSGNKTAITG